MKLKTIWMIWILATIVVVVASAMGFYESLQRAKLIHSVNSWKDTFDSLGGSDTNPFKEISGIGNFSSYSGFIGGALSLALILYGHFTIYKAKQNGETPSGKVFLVLTLFSLVPLIFTIVGIFLSDVDDFITKGQEHVKWPSGTEFDGKEVIDVFNDKKFELVPKAFSYVEPVLSAIKFVTTAAVWWGCTHSAQTSK